MCKIAEALAAVDAAKAAFHDAYEAWYVAACRGGPSSDAQADFAIARFVTDTQTSDAHKPGPGSDEARHRVIEAIKACDIAWRAYHDAVRAEAGLPPVTDDFREKARKVWLETWESEYRYHKLPPSKGVPWAPPRKPRTKRRAQRDASSRAETLAAVAKARQEVSKAREALDQGKLVDADTTIDIALGKTRYQLRVHLSSKTRANMRRHFYIVAEEPLTKIDARYEADRLKEIERTLAFIASAAVK